MKQEQGRRIGNCGIVLVIQMSTLEGRHYTSWRDLSLLCLDDGRAMRRQGIPGIRVGIGFTPWTMLSATWYLLRTNQRTFTAWLFFAHTSMDRQHMGARGGTSNPDETRKNIDKAP